MTSEITDAIEKLSLLRTNLNETSWYEHSILPKEYQIEDFESLWSLCPTTRSIVTVFGKQHFAPRFLKTYGHNYRFSGEDHKSEPITDSYLQKLLDYVKSLNPSYEHNGILVNWYADGEDHIGPHSDDERSLVPGANIYSFSFGATRDFVIKAKQGDQRIVLPLENNSMLVMGGEMQKHYTHGVPVRKKCKERRVNVTIRAFAK
jgi:alkylated DNA repair dioxygenase AlkB